MKIPAGKTEEEVLAAIEKVVNLLAPAWVFGYYDVEDIKQEGRFEALDVLRTEKYDPTRPLENFLFTHIRNRLSNLRRKKYRRTDAPCQRCHGGTPCGEDGEMCPRYAGWRERNLSKANILRPLDIQHIADEKERRTRTSSTVAEDVEISELVRLVDEKLPIALRSSYLQMREGVRLPKERRLQVEAAVQEILEGVI